jgi:hypothetical protein
LKAAQYVDTEINGFEDKIKSATRERDLLIKQHEEERQYLLEKIERLEKENKQMTEKMLKNAREIINSSHTGNTIHKEDQSFHNFHEVVNKTKHVNQSHNHSTVGPVGSRVLTIKMMKDIINEIYASKVDFDKKCLENKMPRETMEQHMYTYLNQKYGLKNLIIEWATSIINGIKMYSSEDSDICLFGRILRNELEEDSRLVINRLKSTIADLLSYYLKTKNPLKSNGDIKDIQSFKQTSFLTEEEWIFIVKYVYESEDMQNLLNRIKDFIRKNLPNKQSNK